MKKNYRQIYENLRAEIISTISSVIEEKGNINYRGDNDATNNIFTMSKDFYSVWGVWKRYNTRLKKYELAVEFEKDGSSDWDYMRNLPIEVLIMIAETLDNPDIYDNDDE